MKMENPCLLGDPELFDPVLLNPDLCAHRTLQDMIANQVISQDKQYSTTKQILYRGIQFTI